MWRTKKVTQILGLFDSLNGSVVNEVGKQDRKLGIETVAHLECCFYEHQADDSTQGTSERFGVN